MSGKFFSFRRKNSHKNDDDDDSATSQIEEEDDEEEDNEDDEEDEEEEEIEQEEEELWQAHPTQDTSVCSMQVIIRLSKFCIRQAKVLPYFKKKRVSGLKEVVVLSPDHVFELLKKGEELI